MSDSPLIGLDCRFAATKAGLGRYTRELVKALLKRPDPWNYVLFRSDLENDGLQELQATSYKLQARHYSLSEQLFFPRLIKQSGIDLFHSLHFNVPLRCPVPFVATIHDLTLHHYPNYASVAKRLAYRFLMRQAVKRSAHIIAISEFTKEDLLKQYSFLLSSSPKGREAPLDSEQSSSLEESSKLSVIPEGISSVFTPASSGQQEYIRDTWHLPQNYFLYVGNAKEHKNVQTLIDAFARVRELHPDPDPTLILVSHGKEIESLRLVPNVRILEDTADLHLRALYTGATAAVLPSLYEGLGLPCLEAMACGCPVIASNRTSIPEVCSDAATLVDPTVEGLSHAMLTILKLHPEGREREEIIQKGLRRASLFTWEYTAEKTAEVYGRILASVSH